MNVRRQKLLMVNLIVSAGLIAALSGTAAVGAAGPPAATSAPAYRAGRPAMAGTSMHQAPAHQRGTRAGVRPLNHVLTALTVRPTLARQYHAVNRAAHAIPAAYPVIRPRQVAFVSSRPRLIRPAQPGRVWRSRVAGPNISCPSNVWEGPPFLNRYDNYVDNGHGVCVVGSTTIHDTTLVSSLTLSGTNFMEANVTVGTGVTLSISAGAAIQVSTTGSLIVQGLLMANGASGSTIAITSTTATPGAWGGIAFLPGSGGTLNFVHLSDAGRNTSLPVVGCCFTTAILVSGASPTIENSTIDFSSNHGIEVYSSGAPTLTGDSFVSNAGFPVRYDFMPSISLIDNGLTASGNGGGNVIDVAGGAVTATLTLQTPGLPIQIEGNLTVNSGAQLSVGAGTVLQDNGGGAIFVEGAAAMTGTATNPVTLTGTSPTPGNWSGLAFLPGSSGTLSFVHLSFAGRNTSYPIVGCCFTTGILVSGAYPTIANSTVDFSAKNGIEVYGSGNPTLTADSLLDNGGYPLRYDFMPSISLVHNGLIAGGNASGDVIDIASGAVTGTLTLQTPGLPIQVEGNLTVNSGAQLSVGAGTVLQENGSGAIIVDGAVAMTGTATNPVSVTNTITAAGSWGGVAFLPGSSGTLSFVHLSFAGRNTSFPVVGCCFATGVLVAGSTPAIANSTIDFSAKNGIEVYTGGNPTLTADSLLNSGGYPLRYDIMPSISLVNNHLIAGGNASGDVIDIAGGNVTGTLTLTTPGLPIRVEGNLTVNSGAQFNVGAGTLLQENGSGQFVVFGSLTMAGTFTKPISVTNTNPAPGAWSGLAFLSGSSGVVSFAHLSFAGLNTSVPIIGCCFAAAVLVNSAAVTITNSTIDSSGGNDVEAYGTNVPGVHMHADSFGAVPGGHFGVLNDNGTSGPPVDATYDWWGSPSGPTGPGGTGSGVAVSLGVSFTPWLVAPPSAVQLTSSRTGGSVGASVTLTGTAFGPGETVNIYWDRVGSTPLATVTVAADGSFTSTITVPQAVFGTHSLIALGQSSGLSAGVAFAITPALRITPSSGKPGSAATVTGMGFGAGETVTVKWNCGSSTCASTIVLGTASTAATGQFSLGVTIPPKSKAGTFFVGAIGGTSGAFARTTFKVT